MIQFAHVDHMLVYHNYYCTFPSDLAAPISSEVVGRLGSGNHTLYLMVTDSDGETAQFSFDFMIAPALGTCMQHSCTVCVYCIILPT